MKNITGKGTSDPGVNLNPKESTDPSKIITIRDMIPRIMEKTGLGETVVREALTLFPQVIIEAVIKGKTVCLDDFGEFSIAKYVPQSLRNSSKKPTPRIIFKPIHKPRKKRNTGLS